MATTVTKTIKASGGDYTSLSAWEAGQQGDLTGVRDEIARAVCYAIDDTASVAIGGWTTSATQYITIEVDATARHAGKWDGDKYNITTADSSGTIWTQEDYIRLDGLQISSSYSGGTVSLIQNSSTAKTAGANELRISNCILKHAPDNSIAQPIVRDDIADAVVVMFNCISYGQGTSTSIYNALIFSGTDGDTDTNTTIYSCTHVGGAYGIYRYNGTVTAKNTYCGGTNQADFQGTIAMTNCASEDTTAGGTNHTHAAVSTDTFVNITAGSEDFHLVAGSALIGAGVDTSGESAPLNFTTDIDGNARDSSWDIGADTWIVSATTKNNAVLMVM